MQTFLPYVDYAASARVLDSQLLNEQRKVNYQIMKALVKGVGPVSHQTTLMWRRYEWALMMYQNAICHEWTDRGHRDVFWDRTNALYLKLARLGESKIWPYWTESERFHLSHQSELLRRDRTYYIQYFPSAPMDMDVVYPPAIHDYVQFNPAPWWEPTAEF